MRVKKFIATTMPEAMEKIRHELGEDAVILVSRNIDTGGFFGLFTKKKIEVIAAADKSPKRLKRKTEHRPAPVLQEEQALLTEIRQLKQELKHVKAPEREHSLDTFSQMNEILKSQEIHQTLRERIHENLMTMYEQQDLRTVPLELQKQWVTSFITDLLQDKKIGGFQYEKRMLSIIGPTGVGKTTTIAKIAAKAVLNDNKKVAFITTDTYRIAAIEQLKTYAKLLNVPVEVAYNLEDFQKANEKFRSYDLVIIDTAGRNFRDEKYIKQLKEIVDFEEEMEIFLVLALTSKYEDMKAIIRQFTRLPIEKVIFTKKDETSSYGAIINVMDEFSLGLAYITDGQNVPEDIVVPSPDYLAQSLFEGVADA